MESCAFINVPHEIPVPIGDPRIFLGGRYIESAGGVFGFLRRGGEVGRFCL